MTVATASLLNTVNETNNLNSKEKALLKKLARNSAGVTSVVTVAEAGAATTTPASTNLRVNGLKAGQRYRVRAKLSTVNATANGGTRVIFSLSGTQTTAVTIGNISAGVTTALGTPAVVGFTNAATTGAATGAVLVNTAYALSGASGGSAVYWEADFTLIPQNDGDLVLQLGSGAGSTATTLNVGSELNVTKLEF